MGNKKLSIITINRNNADGLRKTMESVFAQTCKEFEYIVVDGASTDGSVEVIKEHVNQCMMSNVLWVSEPDSGIYNAMNKGLKMAHGEYALMLNSGDFLVDEHVIERIMPELHTEDMIQGNTIQDFPEVQYRFRGYGRSNISFLDVIDASFPHQAMFIKLSTMTQYGYYDENYKKGSDTYFLITSLGFGNATFRYVDMDIANYDVYGISNNPNWWQVDREEDAKWFGEHMSYRLANLCREAKRTIRLRNTLHRHKWIWGIVLCLAHISEWLSPSKQNVQKEIVK